MKKVDSKSLKEGDRFLHFYQEKGGNVGTLIYACGDDSNLCCYTGKQFYRKPIGLSRTSPRRYSVFSKRDKIFLLSEKELELLELLV